ncbi:MAG: protein-L-isoaspartate(D-aspartate) O-methyltransferase [Acidimicrobiaceae bacterium]|nr:protein-L-isoaspartate(D-aspartate) O-methyltransferase [Acidimicrobiaceae bacterium]MYC41002.1 protein-L-isoaspartate(D-aspartate) O-methyltransferase [Acidimicrobiaceae bacterium]MYH87972.1 protein-L-isoaspartate(D-aspartate) O-methyltransferase [Acidimicrobiaceae bacterium]
MASAGDEQNRSRRSLRKKNGRAGGEEAHRRRRLAMVDKQIKKRGVVDPRVLAAMAAVPRHRFVPKMLTKQAYADHPLPIPASQTISQPYMVALMAEAAEISPSDRVLEVGTGSGYGAAVLSELAADVVTVERHQKLADAAREMLDELGYDNVTVLNADGSLGYPARAPYAAVVVTASSETIPDPLVEQLADGGRLLIPLGSLGEVQHLTRLRRTGDQSTTESLGWVRFVPLIEDR